MLAEVLRGKRSPEGRLSVSFSGVRDSRLSLRIGISVYCVNT